MPSLFDLVLFFSLLDPQVSDLISRMGDDEWTVREKASAALAEMDERPVRLLRSSLASDDLEIRRRSKSILDKYEATIFKSEIPWIDHLPDDFPDRTEVIKKYFRPYRNYHSYDQSGKYELFSQATRDFITDYSRRGHSRAECVELMERMSNIQEAWLSNLPDRKQFYKEMPEDR